MEGSDGMGVEGADSRLYQMIKNEILDGDSMESDEEQHQRQQQDDAAVKMEDDYRRVRNDEWY